jgi:hypothetical protein
METLNNEKSLFINKDKENNGRSTIESPFNKIPEGSTLIRKELSETFKTNANIVEIREFTEDEIRQQFLAHIRFLVDYFDRDTSLESQKERLSALAHSILCVIDGCAVGLPAFILAPLPHADDKQFNIESGENYYPENHDLDVKSDIAGCLHELFYNVR